MALKQGIFDDYVKERESAKLTDLSSSKSKYSHNRVFDKLNYTAEIHELENGQSSTELNVLYTPSINGKQTGNKQVTERETNGKQTGNKRVTNLDQKIQNGKQTGNKRDTEEVQNGKQTVNKRVTTVCLSSLVGIQRQLIISLYQNCKMNGSNTTQEMTLDHLSELTNSGKKSIKTTINRLKKKGYIGVANCKTGRGGWVQYSINQELYTDLLKQDGIGNGVTNGKQTGNKRVTQAITQAITTPSSSSSSINITTTTNAYDGGLILEQKNPMLETIDIEPLAHINFTKSHLAQILKQSNLDNESIQESIYAFAFDLEHNNKAKSLKTSSLNTFLGILLKGKPYLPPENYESPSDKAMRLYLENKRKQQEKRQAMEKEAYDFVMGEWIESLSPAEKNKILADIGVKFTSEAPRLAMLRNYFVENIWPIKAKELGFLIKNKAS